MTFRIGLHKKLSRWLSPMRDKRGVAAIFFALAAPAALGLVGLATEGGLWYLVRMRAQSAADYAAIAGAVRLSNSQPNQGLTLAGGQQQARDAAADVANLDGFATGSSGGTTTTVTVNVPPVGSSNFTNDITAVQVVIQRTMPRLLSGLFLTSDPVVTVKSTSRLVPIAPGACILALSGQLSMGGSSGVTADTCVVGSNASGTSMQMSSNSSVTAKLISLVGSCSGCTGSPPYKVNQKPLRDPFAALQKLTYPSSCPSNASALPTGSYATNPTGTVYWCGNISTNSSIDLAPGTYVIYDGSLKMSGSAQLSCSSCWAGGPGVTLVLSGSSANTVSTLQLTGQASLNLTAPSSGTYAGVAVYRDKLATTGSLDFSGGSGTDIVGGLYAPTSALNWNGGTSSQTSSCHALVAASISFGGSATGSVKSCSKLGLTLLGNGNYPVVE